jgi:dihydroorotase
MINRREFLYSSALLAGLSTSIPLLAAPKYDLLIKGGRVLDPSQKIDRVLDVAVKNGKIAAVQSNMVAADAADVIHVEGRLVTPGLVDIHAHPRPGELPPEKCLAAGVTTVVDGGSRGAAGIQDMLDVVSKAPNRVRVLINVSKLGNVTTGPGELTDLSNVDIEAARAAIKKHRDVIVGVKARLSKQIAGPNDLKGLQLAQEITKPFGIPVMIHMGDTQTPLREIMNIMRKGDIVSHVYAPNPEGILDNNGKIIPEVWEARKRGVLFDIGNGRNGHITWDVAEKALQQNFMPDTISSDLNGAGLTDQVFDFPNVLSKFLMLGMSLNDVIARGTINSANSIPGLKGLGTLKPGAPADIAILELATGTFEFVDNLNTKRTGKQKLLPRGVIMGGKRFG